MTAEEFKIRCFQNRDPHEMLPDGTDAQVALEILAKHFLEDFILHYPASTSQWNSEVVYAILNRYPSGCIRRIPKCKK